MCDKKLVKECLLTKEQLEDKVRESLKNLDINFNHEWFEQSCPALQAGCRFQLEHILSIMGKGDK